MIALVVSGFLGALLLGERRWPLRAATDDKRRRDVRNLAVAAVAGAGLACVQWPVSGLLTRAVARRRLGLLPRLGLPPALETVSAVVLLDATLTAWHWLTHRSELLWRFHAAHHADLDMDATTALRFHVVELVLSVPWRAAQVALLGVRPRPFRVWQTATMISILFHHANVRLPARLERALAWLVVTPRIHGIHHSIVTSERNANWGTIFSFVDRVAGSFRDDVPDTVTVGLPEQRDPEALRFRDVLAMPFRPDASHR